MKLKTLKGIEGDCVDATEPGWSKAKIFEEIKKEAIKCIKEHQLSPFGSYAEFFNITEEDLK